MNHCGQSPLLFVLLGEEDAQNLLGRLVMFERKQQLDRALADVASAQAAPVYCSRPCGAVTCTMASCTSQGKIVSMASASAVALRMRMPRVRSRQSDRWGQHLARRHARRISPPAPPPAPDRSSSRRPRRRRRWSGECGSRRSRRCGACRRGKGVRRRRWLRRSRACSSRGDRRPGDIADPTDLGIRPEGERLRRASISIRPCGRIPVRRARGGRNEEAAWLAFDVTRHCMAGSRRKRSPRP